MAVVIALLSLLSPRQSWGYSVTSPARTPMRTIHVPSTQASTTRRRSGDDIVVVLVKHGCVTSRTTSNNRIWVCGRPGTELTTGISGVKSWKQRACRGKLHDDDDSLMHYYTSTYTVRECYLYQPRSCSETPCTATAATSGNRACHVAESARCHSHWLHLDDVITSNYIYCPSCVLTTEYYNSLKIDGLNDWLIVK